MPYCLTVSLPVLAENVSQPPRFGQLLQVEELRGEGGCQRPLWQVWLQDVWHQQAVAVARAQDGLGLVQHQVSRAGELGREGREGFKERFMLVTWKS